MMYIAPKKARRSSMFLPLIQKRRSIRKFQDKPVEGETLDMLIEAALRAPSSMGNNPWEFIVVREPDMLRKLSKAKQHGATFLKNAPLGIIVCADPRKSSVWVEDASISAIFIHLAAASIGLGSCWIQIRERTHHETKTAEAYISELLGLPAHMKVEAMIGVGYPDEKKPPHGKETLEYHKVHVDVYGKAYPG
jgi:nitroreductase